MSTSIYCGVVGNYYGFFSLAHVFTKFTSFVTEEHFVCAHNSLASHNRPENANVRVYFASSYYSFLVTIFLFCIYWEQHQILINVLLREWKLLCFLFYLTVPYHILRVAI